MRDRCAPWCNMILQCHCFVTLWTSFFRRKLKLCLVAETVLIFFPIKGIGATCMLLFCRKKTKQSACNVSCRCKTISGNQFVQTSFTLISVPTSWSKLERKNGEVPRKEKFGQMECCPMPWFLKTAEDILGPILSIFSHTWTEVSVETCAICFLISYRF